MARITFLLPHLILAGGNRVVGQYAQELVKLGHDVSLIARKPRRQRLRDILRGRVQTDLSAQVVTDYFPGLEGLVTFVSSDRSLRPSDLPDADFLVGTWWETVEWAIPMPPSKGQLVHFMQGYEMFPWLPLDRVAATYEAESIKISVSNWVSEQVLEHHGSATDAIIHNAVDVDHFSFRPERNNDKITLGFVYGPMDIKNSNLAFALQDVLTARGLSCDLLAFHSDPLPLELQDRPGLKSYQRPSQAKIPSLYQQCDLWLFPSLEEGFGLPIIEALSCGTPVVATRAGAAPELIRTGENGYLCETTAESFADAVECFAALGDAEKLEFAQRARDTVTDWTWADCTQRLMDVLEPHLRN
jgi:glycosyltransferase involved in cell wall biosynthesis